MLRVRGVWCEQSMDETGDLNEGNQRFVVWAGQALEKKMEIERALEGRRFSFSLIVIPSGGSSEPSHPLSFHPSSPILFVSTDCQVAELLRFLSSEAGGLASLQAKDAQDLRAMEEILLEEVRVALGAKCVIKICMAEGVMDGARRLRDSAELIRGELGLDLLSGACIAIDDCYEVWDSGFISIPWNFKADELPGMVKIMKAGQLQAPAAGPSPSPTAIRCLPVPVTKRREIPQRPNFPCPHIRIVRQPIGKVTGRVSGMVSGRFR